MYFVKIGSLILLIFNALLLLQLRFEKQQRILLSKAIINENLLKEQLIYTISKDGYELSLTELSGIEDPVLCYYTSDIHCNTCSDSIFDIFYGKIKKYDDLNIALLVSYQNQNDLNMFLRQHKYHGNVVKVNELSCDLFNSKHPLMFVYHPNKNRVSEIIRPIISDMETTYSYVHLVSEKYSAYSEVRSAEN